MTQPPRTSGGRAASYEICPLFIFSLFLQGCVPTFSGDGFSTGRISHWDGSFRVWNFHEKFYMVKTHQNSNPKSVLFVLLSRWWPHFTCRDNLGELSGENFQRNWNPLGDFYIGRRSNGTNSPWGKCHQEKFSMDKFSAGEIFRGEGVFPRNIFQTGGIPTWLWKE